MATVVLHTAAPRCAHRHVEAGYTDVRVSNALFEHSFLLNREIDESISERAPHPTSGAPKPRTSRNEGDCHEPTDASHQHLRPGTGRSAHLCRSAPGCTFCR